MKISSISMHLTQSPMVSAHLTLSHSSVLSKVTKVTATRAPICRAERGQGHPDAHRKSGSNTGGCCSLSSPLQQPPRELAPLTQPRGLQGTSPPSLHDRDSRQQTQGRLLSAQAAAPGDVWALMTTALPTFIPTHPCQGQDKNGEGRKEKKKNYQKKKKKSRCKACPLTLTQAFSACEYLQSCFFLLLQALQLVMGLRTWLLVPARSQAPAPGCLRDKKSLQSLSCSAISVTA